MSSSNQCKLVQTQLPRAFQTVKGARIEKSRAAPKSSSKALRAEKRRLAPLAPQTNQLLVDGGEETIGAEDHEAVFSVKVLQKPSSAFFEGPIKQIPKTKEVADRFRLEAADYPVIRSNTVVRCKDGAPLLYMIKGGMLAGLSPEEQQDLAGRSMSAIRALVKAYPPVAPKAEDPRVTQDQEEQKEKYTAKDQAWGRYYFSYWHDQGQPNKPAHISSHSTPASRTAKRKVAGYMRATTWEHTQVAKWISVLDPEKYAELHTCYQKLGPEELKHLYQGPDVCHSGLALLANLAVDPHKDQNDVRDNWTTTNCWGDFKGGHVVFPDLGFKVAQEPTDLILTHAAVLTHLVEDVEDGERFCHVRFTKKDILRPKELPLKLTIPCPFADCSRVCPSEASLRKHLRGPTGEKRLKARRDCYHFLECKETKDMAKQAMAAYQKDRQGPVENSSA